MQVITVPVNHLIHHNLLVPGAVAWAGFADVDLRFLGLITYVGVIAGFLAYIAWNRGVNLVGPNRAGLFLHLMPVYAALMAAGFLGESLNVHHLVGFMLILAGIVVTTRMGNASKLSIAGGES